MDPAGLLRDQSLGELELKGGLLWIWPLGPSFFELELQQRAALCRPAPSSRQSPVALARALDSPRPHARQGGGASKRMQHQPAELAARSTAKLGQYR